MTVFNSIINLLQEYHTQEELFLVACLEILTLYTSDEGTNIVIVNNLNFLCMFLTDYNFPILQKACFNLMILTGYQGIKLLIELSTKDYLEYQDFILSNLLNTPHIQRYVIVKSLLSDLDSSSSAIRHASLACMNRLYDIIDTDEVLTSLVSYLNNPKIDKSFLCSTIRTSGIVGERLLLKELLNTEDFNFKIILINCLSYRLKRYNDYLTMKLDPNDSSSCIKKLPGNFIGFVGKVEPVLSQSIQNNAYCDISTRDFISSLLRMIKQETVDHRNPRICYYGEVNILNELDSFIDLKIKSLANQSEAKTLSMFKLNETAQDEETSNAYEYNINQEYFISRETIRGIASCLKDYHPAVRDTAALAIGKISTPECEVIIDDLISSLVHEKDNNVKSRIIWAIGKCSQICDDRVIFLINENLRNILWKVKHSCLKTLSAFGERAMEICLPSLIKLLKESPINKTLIAETIIRLGPKGEQSLSNMVNSIEEERNFTLLSAVASAFRLVSIKSVNIDYILESLFYFQLS